METFLKIENIKLWARVGVLDEERELGQLFTLDIFLWTDFDNMQPSNHRLRWEGVNSKNS